MLCLPFSALSKGLDNAGFLKLSDDHKKQWIYSMVDTLASVAAYQDRDKAKCIWNWYYKDTATSNGLIIGSMKKYPSQTPAVLLIALTEQVCGSYATIKKA